MMSKKQRIFSIKAIMVFVTILLLFEGVVSAKPKYKLEAKQRLQEYTVRIYYDDKTGKGMFEILKKGKRVYQKSDESKFYIGSLPNSEDEVSNDLIKMGNDITGNGIPNLVISEWTQGAHCCFNFDVFEFGQQFHFLAKIEAEDGDLSHFANLDGDSDLEFVGNDWTFAYWRTSFAASPTPDVILRFRDGAYKLVEDLMRKPAPSETELDAKIQEVQTSTSWQQQDPPEILWGEMLDLIYSGHADLAWQFFDKAWPANMPGKDGFLTDFRSQLAKSPYWSQIEHLNAEK